MNYKLYTKYLLLILDVRPKAERQPMESALYCGEIQLGGPYWYMIQVYTDN